MNTRYSFSFPPEKIKKPIISGLIRNYNLEINILNADISSGKTGKLVVEFQGEQNDIAKGLDFLKQQGVYYKQILKELNHNAENCVNCGSCSGVCFSGALCMKNSDFCLEVKPELCVLCGICIKACPVQAISLRNGK
jgi:L-aspartate semialdehyde sulfurtransferase ferredoxin